MKKTTTSRRTPRAKSSESTSPQPQAIYHIPHEHFIVAMSFLVIALAGVVFTQSSAQAAKSPVKAKISYVTNCSDPDGLNVTTKGTTAQTKIDNSAKRVKSVTKKTDACISKKIVREYFCGKNDVISSKIVTCPTDTACEKGACIKKNEVAAENILVTAAPPATWCNTSEVTCQDSTGVNLTATCNGDKRQYFECQGRDSTYIDRGVTAGLKDPYGNAIYESTGHCALVEKDCGINNHTCRINGTEKYPSCAFRDEPVTPPAPPTPPVSTSTEQGSSSAGHYPNYKQTAKDGSWCKVTEKSGTAASCEDSRGIVISAQCSNNQTKQVTCGSDGYQGVDWSSGGYAVYEHTRCIYAWSYNCPEVIPGSTCQMSGGSPSCISPSSNISSTTRTPSSTPSTPSSTQRAPSSTP